MPSAPAALSAVDPRSGSTLASYAETPVEEVPRLVAAAVDAAADPALADPELRVEALRGAARALREAGDELRPTCEAETGLPAARVAGELERTCVQLELFAGVVAAGDHLEAIIDPAAPDARPTPRPDLRRMLVPLGPVVVFGASNFPLAFGVAGGDTASALAAGCPVIAKGHPSQPGTNGLVARCVTRAVQHAGLPTGSFASVQGAGQELGEALVDADGVAAVGFTGSTRAGRALYDRASRRAVPIPVHAEMGSVNPAVITVAALARRSGEIREALHAAISFAAGQLCTKPGVVFVPDGPEGDAFTWAVAKALAEAEPGVMLNERLQQGFASSVEELGGRPGVELLTEGTGPGETGFRHAPAVLTVAAAELAERPELREECFGPAVLLARYADGHDLLRALDAFEGQLSAAVFAEEPDDDPLVDELGVVLTARVGRLVFDAFTTGVAVSWAMQHGGPYPATTAPGCTSVGMTATRRFMRPVCWQGAPQHVLPPPLRDANPDGIWRRVDGTPTRAPLGA